MKSILLTSTALVAFAGAAVAESHEEMAASAVVWGADGEFGYNEEVEGGFYFDGGLGVTTSAGMNMGLKAGLVLDVDLGFNGSRDTLITAGNTGAGTFSGISVNASDFVIFVEGQGAALYIGDTKTASEKTWAGTRNMENDGFLEVDDVNDGAKNGDFVDGVIRGDLTYGPVTASLSYLMANGNRTTNDFNGLDGLQVGAVTTFGSVTAGLTYQEAVSRRLVNAKDTTTMVNGQSLTVADPNNPGTVNEVIGVFAASTFAGADVKVAYAQNLTPDASSTGLQLDYPFGPVTATVFYSFESDTEDNYGVEMRYANGPVSATAWYHDGNDEEVGIEGSYDTGMGLVAYAGYVQNDGDSDAYEAYVAAEYDLGGGASLVASYGDDGRYNGVRPQEIGFNASDEIGSSFEVNQGTTVAVKFTF